MKRDNWRGLFAGPNGRPNSIRIAKPWSARGCACSGAASDTHPCGCHPPGEDGDADTAQPSPERPALNAARACYVCKQPYTQVHRYYDSMCRECGDFNYARREHSADLSGRVALVTGARVKIGYQAALKLLRAGARVVALTRFPRGCRCALRDRT